MQKPARAMIAEPQMQPDPIRALPQGIMQGFVVNQLAASRAEHEAEGQSGAMPQILHVLLPAATRAIGARGARGVRHLCSDLTTPPLFLRGLQAGRVLMDDHFRPLESSAKLLFHRIAHRMCP